MNDIIDPRDLGIIKPNNYNKTKIIFSVTSIILLTFTTLFFMLTLYSNRSSSIISREGEDIKGKYSIYKSYKGKIFASVPSDGYYLVPEADVSTFTLIEKSRSFAKDAKNVYCAENKLPKLAPNDQLKIYNNYYLTNGTTTYFCDEAKRNPNANWIDTLFGDHDEESLQKARLYYHEVVEVTNIQSHKLIPLLSGYISDGSSIFYNGKKIEGANGASASIVYYGQFDMKGRENHHYIKDDKNFYYKGKKIPTDETFITFTPDNGQWDDEYGKDSKRYYYQGVAFPDQVDGHDATHLTLFMADRNYANQELFYNEKALFFYDYRENKLKYMCDNPFHGELKTLESGIFYDDDTLYITVVAEQWGRRSTGLIATETLLYKVSNFNTKELIKIEDVKNWYVGILGTLYAKDENYYFKPYAGQFHGYNAPLYAIQDPNYLRQAAKHENSWKEFEANVLNIDSFDKARKNGQNIVN